MRWEEFAGWVAVLASLLAVLHAQRLMAQVQAGASYGLIPREQLARVTRRLHRSVFVLVAAFGLTTSAFLHLRYEDALPVTAAEAAPAVGVAEAAVLVAPPASEVAVLEAAPPDRYTVELSDSRNLIVRSAPAGAVRGALAQGDRVDAMGEDVRIAGESWRPVRQSQKHIQGWVKVRYLRRAEPTV